MTSEKKNRTAYKNEYLAKNYERFNLTVPMGEKDAIQDHAKKQGESTNAFINRAIKETMERDNEKDG